jgi:hypothetical protein
MPFLALAAALLILSGSTDFSPALAQPAAGSLILAHDDETYGDKNEDDAWTEQPDDRGFNLYDDDDADEDGDSAHGPDEDDGWDLDEFERSERA